MKKLKIGIFSRGMLRIPHLEELLDATIVPKRWGRFPDSIDGVAGWGYKPTSAMARRYAEMHALPYLAIEDGFLRSLGLGRNEPPLSLVVDDLGIFYDATRPSRLETLIRQPLDATQRERACALLASWRSGRVSKYNSLREYAGELPPRYVLVVDQTFGDASVACGLANADSFNTMLRAALDEHTDCTVLVKVHPDVFAGKKRGYFDVAALTRIPRVQVLAENVHPVRLIEHAQAVYTVTSQLGFEALLWGKPVRTFGMPFYAGWGLTSDELVAPKRRRVAATLDQLVHATLIAYPRYLDPERGTRCEVETVLAHITLQRQMRNRFPAQVHAVGFSIYKRPIVRDFLQGSVVRFHRNRHDVPEGSTLFLWGRQEDRPGIRLVRLEDGFLRSVGLGADLIRPVSLVMDTRGIYFDATRPSDLEYLLQHQNFDITLCARARALRTRIVEAGLTKYNVGTVTCWQRPPHAARVILVPGQVETDASIVFGAPGIRRNLDLLRAVRTAHPDAYILYKPHPDVLAGLRAEGHDEREVQQWCDEIVGDVAMGELLREVDEVHVLTSLTGFEALLRGKAVTCYGQPFYAGWGLTTDIVPIARRTRRLTLDELVAGALICYPVYLSRVTGRYTTPERVLDELLAWRATDGGVRLPNRFYRLLRRIFVRDYR